MASVGFVHRPRHTRLAQHRAHELRKDLTISEARLWSQIRGRKLGARFRRQVPIGIWIVDFACLDPMFVIEVDDVSHDYRDETERTTYPELKGFCIVRFTNKEVAMDLDIVVATIEELIAGH